MKYCILTLLMMSLLLFESCKEKKTPVPETFLKVSMGAFVTPDFWVFATDASGKVLDCKQLSSQGSVYLNTSATKDSVNLTYFSYITGFGYLINTFSGISKDSELDYTSTYTRGNPLGVANITVTGYSYAEGNSSSGPWFSDGIVSSPATTNTDMTVFTRAFNLTDGASDILVTGYNKGTPYYKWLMNVQVGDNLAVDFSSFTPYEKTISFQESNIVVGDIKGGKPNTLNGMLNYDFCEELSVGTGLSLGYLEGFSTHSMDVISNIKRGGLQHQIEYKTVGPINQKISFPAYDFSTISTSMDNFSFSFSGPYAYTTASWRTDSNNPVYCLWNVYSVDKPAKITELPSEITTNYPAVNLSKFSYVSSSFHISVQSYTYHSFVKDYFISTTPTTLESFDYTISQ